MALAMAVGLPVLALAFLYQSPSTSAPDKAAAVVWAVGDGADGSEAARDVVEQIREGAVDRLLYLGDVYETGTREEFADGYDSVYGDLAEITSPAIGNHEFHNRAEGYLPYWERVHGQEQPLYYSFDLAGWELISLNSEREGETHELEEQLAWLEGELSEPGTCRVPFWHAARYSAVPGGDEPRVEPFWEALEGHTEVIVSAHEHNMQRFNPIDGITQLVSGAGGHGLYELDPGDPRLAWGSDTDYGALRMELEPGLLRYEFVAGDGELLDSGTITCRPLKEAP